MVYVGLIIGVNIFVVTSLSAGNKKRRRCNNLFDSFSYKFVTSELGLSKPTINDWCCFAREVCVN